MKLPDQLEPPAVVTVCEICWRAGCWHGLLPCYGISQGRPKTSLTLTGEQAAELAYEAASFWHPPRAAGQTPRDVSELLDVVGYMSTLPGAKRHKVWSYLVEDAGLEPEQVDAAMAQAWPMQVAS